jgi:DNA polymerase III epsilon subunit-like protein
MKLRCFDLETTSVDVKTCHVLQAGIVDADVDATGMIDMTSLSAQSMLFHAASIPEASTRVHKITAEMVADCKPFEKVVRSFAKYLLEPDTVIVTFNGTTFDIPAIARVLALRGSHAVGEVLGYLPKTLEEIEVGLRRRHVDIMRLWHRTRAIKTPARWGVSLTRFDRPMIPMTAECFAGSLTGAHAFWCGEPFETAHDAEVDGRATLIVFDAMLRSKFLDIETAVRWSNEPLPGDVDFAGSFKWDGDRCIIGFGKHKGTPLESIDAGFLNWMLGKDFAAGTKDLVRQFQAGKYPVRQYENERDT